MLIHYGPKSRRDTERAASHCRFSPPRPAAKPPG